MRRIVLIVLILIFFLLVSIFSSTAISNTTGPVDIPADSEASGWWDHWIRDVDLNGIDDVLDDMMASNPGSTRTKIFIDYIHPPTEEDTERLSVFDLNIQYVYHIVDTICAREVLLSDIEDISQLPGVVMVEYEEDITGFLDISAKAVKARDSTVYVNNSVHEMGIYGSGIPIAILDTGVDDDLNRLLFQHHDSVDDLDDDILTDDPKFVAGADVRPGFYAEVNPDDEVSPGHGTHVAGIAMGTGAPYDSDDEDVEYDRMGVAPQALLIDVKVIKDYRSGTGGELLTGIQWCVDNKDEYGIRIMSMSLGSSGNSDGSDTISQAVNAAVDEGLIAVVAIGNDGANIVPTPAAADKAITVGGTNDMGTVNRTDDQLYSLTNYGPRWDDGDEDHLDELKPDVVAPGTNIISAKCNTNGQFISYDGTSMATPHVSGVIALMLEANPDLTPAMVKDILHKTSEMPEGVTNSTVYDDKYNYQWGWGMVDAYEAVKLAQTYDDRPPIISHINHDVSGNTVTINWHTHKAANSIVEYGQTGGTLDQKEEDLETYVFDHTMVITGLEQATNYSYNIKGYDEQGNGPGESGIRFFDTPVLPDTTPPNILNVNSFPSYSTATIMWETDENADSLVEYGKIPGLGMIKENEGEFGKDHSVTLTNLEPGTTYYFRVNSTDASNNTNHSIVATFITTNEPTDPPDITQGPDELDKTETSVTIEWKTNKPTNSVLSYRTELEDWKAIPEPQDQYQIDHSIPITGLSPSTQYYYKIEFEDSEGNSDEYIDGAFVTEGPPDLTPPGIESGPELIILTDTTATIVWVTDEESDSLVRYGITDSYGLEEPSDGPTDEYVTIHNITLTDLSHSTTYHYQVESRDTSPNKNEATSGDYTFTTKPKADLTKPKIIAGPTVLVVGEDTATIVWTTDEDSDSVLHYGTDDSYGQTVSDPTLVIGHEVTLPGLIPSTPYHFKVRSTDASGNWQESQDREFTTLDIIIPIDIEFLNIANGEIIKDVKTVEARITGGEGLIIHGVRYKIDDGAWENLGSGSAFSITIDSASLEEGEHTLYVEVTVGKLSQEVTMQEDVTFVVEHEEVDNSVFFMGIGFAMVIVLILGAAIFIRNSAIKRRKERAEATEMEPFGGSPFTPMDFSSDTDIGFGFIPEEEPVIMADTDEDISFAPDIGFEETELGISFVPDAPILMEDPDIAFVPDMAPVSFDTFAEEPEPVYSQLDKIRCPKCRRTFETDLSSDVDCPHCGFSSGVKTW